VNNATNRTCIFILFFIFLKYLVTFKITIRSKFNNNNLKFNYNFKNYVVFRRLQRLLSFYYSAPKGSDTAVPLSIWLPPLNPHAPPLTCLLRVEQHEWYCSWGFEFKFYLCYLIYILIKYFMFWAIFIKVECWNINWIIKFIIFHELKFLKLVIIQNYWRDSKAL
jgi:hypothetical protein